MSRYLLFDAGCSLCTNVAEDVRQETDGWLEPRGLDDPEMVSLLDRAVPAWKREPTLLVVSGDSVTAYTGRMLTWKLVNGVGLTRASRVARRLSRTLRSETPTSPSRRQALRAAGAGLTALAGMAVLPQAAFAAPPAKGQVLSGGQLRKALTTANSSASVVAAKQRIAGLGYETNTEQNFVFDTGEGSTVVMQYFGNLSTPETEAAVITHEFGSIEKTAVEFVTADRAVMAAETTVNIAEAMKVTNSVPGEDIVLAGVAAYVDCIVFCTGANCASAASKCKLLRYLPAILACMTGVCGTKVPTCHKICKSKF